MGGRHEQVPSSYGYQVRVLMDCWDRLFFDDESLEPPGREEAVKRALQRSEEKRQAKLLHKPRGRGKG